jgi:hypothetical protein
MAAAFLKPHRARATVLAFVAVGACTGADGGTGGPTPPSPSTATVTLDGTWTGPASDSSGSGAMSWQLSQTGASFSGPMTMVDTATGVTGRGSVSGTASGSSIRFSISIPAGGFDSPFDSCSANVSGEGQATSSAITGTYAGSSSCSGSLTSGQFTVNKE